MSLFWIIVIFSLIGGVFSLIGGIFLLKKIKAIKQHSCILTSFAAGVLLAVSFLGLIPEAMKLAEKFSLNKHSLCYWPLVAIVAFFLLEQSLFKKKPVSGFIIAGEAMHNYIDGLVITGGFLVNVSTGIITALAVAAHEIPKKMVDFGLLINGGLKPIKVFWVSFLTALMTLVGAITAWYGIELITPLRPQLIAFTAGMFIYIAASNLIPELHHEKENKIIGKISVAFLAGIGLIMLVVKATYGLE